jgi:Bifunctional DNA primase/polymerase, N-terminal
VTGADNSRALAAALALGLPAFPCSANKAPAIPGSGGYIHATADPARLRELWRDYPGALIGVPMGEASGLDTLDIDAPRHPEAVEWWVAHRDHLPPTKVHKTRSGGVHMLFAHATGLRCSAGKIAPGIDVRSSGGFIVWWPAIGLPVLSDAPLAHWPQWLLDELMPRPAPPPTAWTPPCDQHRYRAGSRYATAAFRNATERVARASVGCRNTALNREAYGLSRLIAEGLLDVQEVADSLAAAAIAAGLAEREVEVTLRSAFTARGLL